MAHALVASQFRLGRGRHMLILERALADRTEDLRRSREETIRRLVERVSTSSTISPISLDEIEGSVAGRLDRGEP